MSPVYGGLSRGGGRQGSQATTPGYGGRVLQGAPGAGGLGTGFEQRKGRGRNHTGARRPSLYLILVACRSGSEGIRCVRLTQSAALEGHIPWPG